MRRYLSHLRYVFRSEDELEKSYKPLSINVFKAQDVDFEFLLQLLQSVISNNRRSWAIANENCRYFYRLKLSPDPSKEDTKRDLNMQKLTRQMMQRLEKRLKTTIPWAGSLHDDHTNKRHVYILAAIPRRLQKYELEALIAHPAPTRISY
jgi:hypothetical protein